MPTSSVSQVKQAIQKLKALYRIGLDSLRRRPAPAPFGDRAIEFEARERGINCDVLYKARVFAGSPRGYTQQELAKLCALCRAHQYPLGWRQLFRLLRITPKRQRAKV